MAHSSYVARLIRQWNNRKEHRWKAVLVDPDRTIYLSTDKDISLEILSGLKWPPGIHVGVMFKECNPDEQFSLLCGSRCVRCYTSEPLT